MSCGLFRPGRSRGRQSQQVRDLLDEVQIGCAKVKVQEAGEEEMQQRLSDLRTEIADAKVDWYVVPSEDEHQSEEVGPSDQRRAWISNFTGSAGAALIPSSGLTEAKALLFVDSRYWVQADRQIPKEGWEVRRVGGSGGTGPAGVVNGWIEWVIQEVEDGSRIGIDPKLIAYDVTRSIRKRLADTSSSTQLIPLSQNLVDAVKPPPPRSLGPLLPHPISLSGESTTSKLARVRESLQTRTSSLCSSLSAVASSDSWIYVLPTLPAIAWLLNFRCPTDISFCPVAYAYLALTPETCILFVDGRKVTDEELKKDWEDAGVEVRDYGVDALGKFVKKELASLRAEEEKRRVKIWAPAECSWGLANSISGSTSSLAADEVPQVEVIPCPVEPLKSIKNKTEQDGMRAAYLRDGRAMVRWLAWLEGKIMKEKRDVGEWAGAQVLTRYRRGEEGFRGLAYEDILGSGPNGALPHYAPERGKDRLIDPDATFVIDSGAQYVDGTIDTTRTLYLGKSPSDDVKRAYTRVLQGHIAVSQAVFPEGSSSDWLNGLGRRALYEDGLDFGHGLGHGVGSYLSVHERPVYPHGETFRPGHVTTIEPGFYKEGEWGIRIESLLLCKRVDTMYDFGGKKWLSWERLTQVPIQTSLVEWKLMSKPEIRWLNEHNDAVRETLMPLLQEDQDAEARDWLKKVTKSHKIWPWT